MQPITPLLETPAGRLAELVHLLSDTPLDEAVEAIGKSSATNADHDDPWWIIAGALVDVRQRQAPVYEQHELRMPA